MRGVGLGSGLKRNSTRDDPGGGMGGRTHLLFALRAGPGLSVRQQSAGSAPREIDDVGGEKLTRQSHHQPGNAFLLVPTKKENNKEARGT